MWPKLRWRDAGSILRPWIARHCVTSVIDHWLTLTEESMHCIKKEKYAHKSKTQKCLPTTIILVLSSGFSGVECLLKIQNFYPKIFRWKHFTYLQTSVKKRHSLKAIKTHNNCLENKKSLHSTFAMVTS